MTSHSVSSRRVFLKGGALLAAPLAAAAAPALASADRDGRLARLEDEAAIRALHQDWMRRISAADPAEAARFAGEAVHGLATDHAGGPELIELSEDGLSAIGRYAVVVETGAAIPRDFTLGQMAHAQGGGFVRRSERRVLRASYAKLEGGWAIRQVQFDPA